MKLSTHHMLSKSSQYAIRAVLYLSLNSNEERKYSPKEIAKAIDIPAPFLAKTLQDLTRRSLISSIKGRNGGFYLSQENRHQTLISIVDSIDGIDKFQECILGLTVCSNENPCSLHNAISPLRKKLVEELTFKTINDLSIEVVNGTTHII
jgi:Rrf2 family protein